MLKYTLLVPLQARSPILRTDNDLASNIDAFWRATTPFFHKPPHPSPECKTSIYICPSPGWTLQNLKTVAKGILYYEDLIQEMLPSTRRTVRPVNHPCTFAMPTLSTGRLKEVHPCRSNTSNISLLNSKFHEMQRYASWQDQSTIPPPDPRRRARVMNEIELQINALESPVQILRAVQNDRDVLWDFSSTAINPMGMLRFGGAAPLQDAGRTKAWLAFVAGFIHFLLTPVRQALLHTFMSLSLPWHGMLRSRGSAGGVEHAATAS